MYAVGGSNWGRKQGICSFRRGCRRGLHLSASRVSVHVVDSINEEYGPGREFDGLLLHEQMQDRVIRDQVVASGVDLVGGDARTMSKPLSTKVG